MTRNLISHPAGIENHRKLKTPFTIVTIMFLSGMCLFSACAMRGSAPGEVGAPPPDALKQVDEHMLELQRNERLLGESLQAGAGVDCARACSLVGNIERLAKKICKIARRHPESSALQARCQKAAESKKRASSRLAGLCECNGDEAGQIPAGR